MTTLKKTVIICIILSVLLLSLAFGLWLWQRTNDADDVEKYDDDDVNDIDMHGIDINDADIVTFNGGDGDMDDVYVEYMKHKEIEDKHVQNVVDNMFNMQISQSRVSSNSSNDTEFVQQMNTIQHINDTINDYNNDVVNVQRIDDNDITVVINSDNIDYNNATNNDDIIIINDDINDDFDKPLDFTNLGILPQIFVTQISSNETPIISPIIPKNNRIEVIEEKQINESYITSTNQNRVDNDNNDNINDINNASNNSESDDNVSIINQSQDITVDVTSIDQKQVNIVNDDVTSNELNINNDTSAITQKQITDNNTDIVVDNADDDLSTNQKQITNDDVIVTSNEPTSINNSSDDEQQMITISQISLSEFVDDDTDESDSDNSDDAKNNNTDKSDSDNSDDAKNNNTDDL